ncbi:hypothetical protein BCR34DRAFT_582420 [Clohesyomyces aquaticus]|uniref:Thioester reductase (TE) domain-containing protein n=1 Tax=Clohesyomyces aquaticus TaxID=1231657 RepID=A0A1Y2A9S2_9PLEO|nr:hypothetical protein BCR34DRAFT_582420 [Clohesyomyces aquaticus]
MGYGESKCVAERILGVVNQVSGVRVSILRIGQIGGPAEKGSGVWPVQEWLRAIVKTGRVLGPLPRGVAPVDWMPVDRVAGVVADVSGMEDGMEAEDKGLRISNVVHPEPVSWDVFLETLRKYFGVEVEIVGLPEWLGRLESVAQAKGRDRQRFPALIFYDFLRKLREGLEGQRVDVRDMNKVSRRDIAESSEELIAGWPTPWDI